jgi:hypothetical protein
MLKPSQREINEYKLDAPSLREAYESTINYVSKHRTATGLALVDIAGLIMLGEDSFNTNPGIRLVSMFASAGFGAFGVGLLSTSISNYRERLRVARKS